MCSIILSIISCVHHIIKVVVFIKSHSWVFCSPSVFYIWWLKHNWIFCDGCKFSFDIFRESHEACFLNRASTKNAASICVKIAVLSSNNKTFAHLSTISWYNPCWIKYLLIIWVILHEVGKKGLSISLHNLNIVLIWCHRYR